MNLKELIRSNRSYRRFDGCYPILHSTLLELVDLTRYTSSARNAQPLRYFLSSEKEMNDLIFPHLAWAGYLKSWDGPSEQERPTAYIIIVEEIALSGTFTPFDAGLVCQSILLGATEWGLGGCIIASVKKEKLRNIIQLDPAYEILLVIALGKPMETVVIDEMTDNNFKYWRDEENIHHVPKRNLEDIVL